MRYIIFYCLGLAFLFNSCSSFKETHYFKDTLEPVANYYKVEVRGYSFLSSSRYVSGYYDRTSIQEYFGELGQPEKARFVPATTNPADQNKELVLLLSSNSDAIANGFSNIVKNKTTMNSVALLANKDKIEQSAAIKAERSEVDNKIEMFKMRVEANLLTDSAGLNEAQIEERYIQFVKSELSKMYPGEDTPNTLDLLYKWLLNKQN
ncbi:hypothetical protein [Flavobacterium sp.]|uniref:hypothetical protein n=1 Tax=Flavobacterium sp. TaxID=239 RepID=UPI002604290E|nr:hypothetical protein [Flavobacterium sp.]